MAHPKRQISLLISPTQEPSIIRTSYFIHGPWVDEISGVTGGGGGTAPGDTVRRRHPDEKFCLNLERTLDKRGRKVGVNCDETIAKKCHHFADGDD